MARITYKEGWYVDLTQDSIEVTSLSHIPDLTWTFSDSQGHLHTWWAGEMPIALKKPEKQHDATKTYRLPTLTPVVETHADEWDGEPYDMIVGYMCKVCGERITPGTRPPEDVRVYQVGMKDCDILITMTSGDMEKAGNPDPFTFIDIGAYQVDGINDPRFAPVIIYEIRLKREGLRTFTEGYPWAEEDKATLHRMMADLEVKP